jgi:hypothetical protein
LVVFGAGPPPSTDSTIEFRPSKGMEQQRPRCDCARGARFRPIRTLTPRVARRVPPARPVRPSGADRTRHICDGSGGRLPFDPVTGAIGGLPLAHPRALRRLVAMTGYQCVRH